MEGGFLLRRPLHVLPLQLLLAHLCAARLLRQPQLLVLVAPLPRLALKLCHLGLIVSMRLGEVVEVLLLLVLLTPRLLGQGDLALLLLLLDLTHLLPRLSRPRLVLLCGPLRLLVL